MTREIGVFRNRMPRIAVDSTSDNGALSLVLGTGLLLGTQIAIDAIAGGEVMIESL